MVRTRVAGLAMLLLVIACRGERIVEPTPKGDFEITRRRGRALPCRTGRP
jgi:hypothetical protein